MSDKEHELQARRLANAIAYGGGDQPVGYVDAAKKLAFSEVIAENERLKDAIRRLAEEDATLSVCEGNVTVTMDATLTDAEREAVEWAVKTWVCRPELTATLRGLLERLK
jgi:hypothetical protein